MGMFSGLFSGGEGKRAAGVAAAAQKQAGELVNQRYQDVKGNYQPYMDAGTGALSSYQNVANGIQGQVNPILGQMGNTVNSMNPIIGKLTSDNLNDYQKSPGYDFRMQQGQKALENSAAAEGTLFSGATGKALQKYGQNFGSNEYQNYLGNLQNQLTAVNSQIGAQGNYLNSTINGANASLNAYSPLINTGYNAANAQAQAGMGAAEQQGQYIAGAGATTAAGMMANANQLQNAGSQWIKLGAMAAGGAAGGAGMLGGMGAMQGAMAGGAMSSGIGGGQMLPMNPGNLSYQPMQNSAPQAQPSIEGLPWKSQPTYQQPQSMPYQGTNYYNSSQGQSNGWKM